ncbi:uncharacterized protein [Periplaneta americana]|uniref:uncharacterized protein n=1 Tax=Periplaneta americana TaxID=6978 RepID=UPI0037E8B6D0
MTATEQHGYKKKGGTGSMSGSMYEMKLAGFVFLRVINMGQRFLIASNMNAAGKFDDVVLKVGNNTIFAQSKHKEMTQNTVNERRYSTHEVFNIQEQYESYRKLKKSWGETSDLQHWGRFSDVQFAVFTNAVVNEGEVINDTNAYSVFMTKGKCVRFCENDFPTLKNKPGFNQFLGQFMFYTEQADVKQLDGFIRTELRKSFGTDSQFDKFLSHIMSWWEGRPGLYLTEKVEFWENMFKCSNYDICKAKVDQLVQFNLQFNEKELKNFEQKLPDGGGILSVQKTNSLTCLKVHQSIEKKIIIDSKLLQDRMSEVLALWGRRPEYDILVIDGWTQEIEGLIENLGSGKTLVLIYQSEEEGDLQSRSYKDTFRFEQLDEESKKIVLDCEVNFQGVSIQLNALCDSRVMDKVASAEFVTEILSGKLEKIGMALTPQFEYYIPRNFVSTVVSETIFCDDQECLVVSGISIENLKKLIPLGKTIKKFDVRKCYGRSECRCFVIEEKEDFEKATHIFDPVHWLHKEETGFTWKQSKGSTSYIKAHLSDKTSIRNLPEAMLYPSKVKLLVANPGMGKSIEITNIAQEFKRDDPACWVVTVLLNDHTDYLNNLEHFTVENSVVELLLRAGEFTDFARSSFTHELKHGGNIVILIDGFDEICPDYTDKVLHMIRQLFNYKFKQLWITSRFVMKEKLENEFSSIAFELQPFTECNQRHFLAKIWSDINGGPHDLDKFITNLLEVTGKSLNDEHGQLTKIPLQTRMLAEVFQTEASRYCQSGEMMQNRKLDLLDLYIRFVDRKWKICIADKGRVDTANLVQRAGQVLQWDEFESNHMLCAVHSLLKSDELDKLQFSQHMRRVENFHDQFRNGKEKSGIVAQIVDSRAVFIHRTFVEFFAAKWFTKNFEIQREYLKEMLFNPEFKTVRKFFDRILAEGCQLHTAILNEDKLSVLQFLTYECNVNEKDKGGRTPLHLAVVNHIESDDVPNKTASEIMDLLLLYHPDCTIEDEVFRWRPLTLADKLQAWSAADTLLGSHAERSDMTLSMELIKDRDFVSRILKTVALRGYINIAKFMFECGTYMNHPIEKNFHCANVTTTMLHIAAGAGQTELVEFLLEVAENRNSVNSTTMDGDTGQSCLQAKDSVNRTALDGDTDQSCLQTKDSVNRTALDGDTGQSCLQAKDSVNTTALDGDTGQSCLQAKDSVNTTALEYYLETKEYLNDTALASTALPHSVETKYPLNKTAIARPTNEGCPEMNESSNLPDLARTTNQSRLETKDSINGTALAWAASEGRLQTVRMLVEKGVNINTQDLYGDSPLFYALFKGHVDVVKLLLQKGGDIHTCYELCIKSLLKAVSIGDAEFAKLLIDSGVDVNACDTNGDNPLLIALRNNCLDIVTLLIERGANVNVCNKDGDSAIFVAMKYANVHIIKLLIGRGADVHSCNKCGNSPIFAAVRRGSAEIVRLLIESHTNVNACNKSGNTLIFVAVNSGNIDVISLLIERGGNVNAHNSIGNSPLFAAVRSGNMDIVRLLIDKGANVNAHNNIGNSPLFAAVRSGNMDIVRLLIDKGANVNAHNNIGNSPLFAAVRSGNVDVVRFLIERGADINACNKRGNRPIFLAVKRGMMDVVKLLRERGANVDAFNKNSINPICFAVKNGDVNVVRLLIETGANVNACNRDGDSSIFVAGQVGNVDILELLIARGANVNACNNYGNTPIFAAVTSGSEDAVKLLIARGANLNACNRDGDSPIFAAVRTGDMNVVRLLTEGGANFNVSNIAGDSPLFVAEQCGNEEVVRFLRGRADNVNACTM